MSEKNCFGTFSSSREECRGCKLKKDCRESRKAGMVRDTRLVYGEDAARAVEQYADLPAEIRTPGGGKTSSYKAFLAVVVFLASLSKSTLAAVRAKFEEPGFSRAEVARYLGISRVSDHRKGVDAIFADGAPRVSGGLYNVYLSGPMSGLPELNAPAFCRAEEQVREATGWNVVNPVYTAYLMGENREYEHLMTVAMAIVETSDLLVMLPGWEHSAGARREHDHAVELGIPVKLLGDLI